MLARFRRPSHATVVAYAALFIALGGVSYAAITLPRNSVGPQQIKRGAVKTADLGKDAVTSAKVMDGSLLLTDFKSGQLPAGAGGRDGTNGTNGRDGTDGTNGTDGADGADGAPGTARAYGRVAPDGTLDANRSRNVVSVSHTSNSTYCITLADGIDVTTTSPVAVIDANTSEQASKVTVGPLGISDCAPPKLAIATSKLYDADSTDPDLNEVGSAQGFLFIVP